MYKHLPSIINSLKAICLFECDEEREKKNDKDEDESYSITVNFITLTIFSKK